MIKNLYELYNLIEKVSTALPNVNQFVNSFDSLNREDTSYAAVVLQFRDGTQATEGTVRYRFYLGYVDRVNENTDTPSTSNNILTQSIAEENIRLIINKLYPEVDITFGNTFYPFTQRFTALTAGCYVELAITLAVKDCNYESGSVLRDVEIVSDSNGVKEVVPGAGVDGFKKVIVRTEVPLKTEIEKDIVITENGNTTYTPDEGQSFSKVNVDVNVPIKEEVTKEVSITSNGLTTITPPAEKTLSKVDVTVNVPIKTEVAKDIVINENGNTTYTPNEGEVFNSVNVDVNIPSKTEVAKDIVITENGNTTYTPNEGEVFNRVSVNVNVSSSGDTMKYFNEKPTADTAGLKEIGWDDESVNYYKYNNYAYPWEADNYKVGDTNKQIVLNNKSDIATYKDNPDFQYCPKFDTSAETDMNGMFNGCSYLTYIPQLDTHSVTNMNNMFDGCTSLTSIPLLDTHSVTNMNNMFNGCSSLTSIPMLDTSSVTDMSKMFMECNILTSIPTLYTSNVTNMSNMFFQCRSLISIPQLDTSKVTNMSGMFYGCNSLTTIPQLDTSNVTLMGETERYSPSPWIPTVKTYGMFQNCKSLTTIPMLNTSNVTNMEKMFMGCTSLTTIPQLDTSKLEGSRWMFDLCDNLVSVPRLDMSNNVACYGMFGQNGELRKLTDIGGLIGLKDNLQLDKCPNLTHNSLMNVINDAADVTADPKTLTLGTTNLNKLTDADKAIAINKGWTLA